MEDPPPFASTGVEDVGVGATARARVGVLTSLAFFKGLRRAGALITLCQLTKASRTLYAGGVSSVGLQDGKPGLHDFEGGEEYEAKMKRKKMRRVSALSF